MSFLAITIVGTMIGTMLAIEAKAWMPYVSHRLVRSTLDRMPNELDEDMQSRWGEEIEADLASYGDRPLGGLVFAVGVARKGGRGLAAELMLEESLEGGEEDARGIKVVAATLESGEREITYEASNGRRARRMIGPDDDFFDAGVLSELFGGGKVRTIHLEMTIMRKKEE
jgi:hypothetical protein